MAFIYLSGSFFWRRRCGFLRPRDVFMGTFVSSSSQQSSGSKVGACTHFRNWHSWCRGISCLGPIRCLVLDISHRNSFHPRSLHCKYSLLTKYKSAHYDSNSRRDTFCGCVQKQKNRINVEFAKFRNQKEKEILSRKCTCRFLADPSLFNRTP